MLRDVFIYSYSVFTQLAAFISIYDHLIREHGERFNGHVVDVRDAVIFGRCVRIGCNMKTFDVYMLIDASQ